MPKREIRNKVEGYPDVDGEAFNRMFERDKEMLRDLGFELVTIGTDGHGEDIGYRVVIPQDTTRILNLTPFDVAVLRLAATQWRSVAPQRDITTALIKLRALDADMIEGLADGLMPSAAHVSSENEAAYEVFIEALTTRREVTFSYWARSHGQTQVRHVQPWQVAARAGGFYMIGYDLDRKEPRIFHFERIVGTVKISGPQDSYSWPTHDVIQEAAQSLSQNRPYTAILRLAPGRCAEIRRNSQMIQREPDGWDRVTTAYSHLDTYARQLASFGDGVVVVEPARLRERVIQLLAHAVELERRVASTNSSQRGEGA